MALVVVGEQPGARHIGELVVDHADAAACRLCLLGGEPDGGDLGKREHDLRHPAPRWPGRGPRGASTGGPWPRAIASPQTRAWYFPMCVSNARWFTSPAAYSQPPSTAVTRRVSSAVQPRPGLRPTVSRPMSAVLGRAPDRREHLVRQGGRPVVQRQRDRPPRARGPGGPACGGHVDAGAHVDARVAQPRRDEFPREGWHPVEQPAARTAASPGSRAPTTPRPSRSPRRRRRRPRAGQAPTSRWSRPGWSTGSPRQAPTARSAARPRRDDDRVPRPQRDVADRRPGGPQSAARARGPGRSSRPRSQETCPSSFQSCVKASRRLSTSAASSRAPLTPRHRGGLARPRRPAGRSRALLGMHAQYEHSPPTSSDSTITAVSPPRTARPATFSPVGPAPITITSYTSAVMRPPVQSSPAPVSASFTLLQPASQLPDPRVANHGRRVGHPVELLRRDVAKRQRRLAQRRAVMVGLVRDLGGPVVPDHRGKRGDQH